MKKNHVKILWAVPCILALMVSCSDNSDSASESLSPSISQSVVSTPVSPSVSEDLSVGSTSVELPSEDISTPSVNTPSTPVEDTSTSVEKPSTPTDQEEPDNPNYGGQFILKSADTGTESIHIEGAGVWIWVEADSIGYKEGVNVIQDFSVEVEVKKGALTIISQQIDLYEGKHNPVRVYLALSGAPTFKDELTFYVKISAPDGKFYDNTVEFIGKNWKDAPSVEKIDGGNFELYTTGVDNEVNRIDGAGVWIWIKSDSVGFDGTNWSDLQITKVEIDNDNFIVSDYYPSDPNETRFRIYIVLDKGITETDAITFTIRIENATTYYTGSVSFLGNNLVA